MKSPCYLAEKYAEYNFTQRGAATVAVQCDKPVEVEPPAMMSKLGEWMPKITQHHRSRRQRRQHGALHRARRGHAEPACRV